MRDAKAVNLLAYPNARYIPVVGPRFGGKGERHVMGKVLQCDTVGMSLLPELDLITIENMSRPDDEAIRVGPIQIVTDNQDHPSDADVVAAAAAVAPKVGNLIGLLLKDENW